MIAYRPNPTDPNLPPLVVDIDTPKHPDRTDAELKQEEATKALLPHLPAILDSLVAAKIALPKEVTDTLAAVKAKA